MSRFRFSRHDALLLLMTVIWGVNYGIVKVALREIPPLPFNALRLGLASVLFLAAIGLSRRTRISRRDWLLIAAFGLIGHFIYQMCFMFGLDRTTAANSALILGCSPVVVALLSAAVGHEQVGRLHWAGAVLSVVGIYFVVGRGARLGGATASGDALTLAGLFCWGVYTVGVRGLLNRHSPLEVTGYSMAIGTIPYALVAIPQVSGLPWRTVPAAAWAALIFSGVFALFVAYLIWYMAVQRIGNIRTAMYSNLTPIAALVVAVVWVGERLTGAEIVGATAILTGMAITRLVRAPDARSVAPAEE